MSTTELEHQQDTEAPETGLLHREFAADITRGDGRTVDVRIVPFGERIRHNDGLGGLPRGEWYEEEFMPGAFDHQLNAAHRVLANFEHQQGMAGLVGKGVALRSAPDGYHGTFRILEGSDGDKLLQLLPDAVDGVSLEAKPMRSTRSADGVVQRVKAHLVGIAFTRFGAYQGAKVLAVREEAQTIIDEAFLPVEIDPELIERCRRLGVELPQRFQAHPDDTDTSASADTSEPGTRPSDTNNNTKDE
jgi:HK97 family phage prohead protease